MKRILVLFVMVSMYHIVLFGQKKYEMVIEKTDGSEVVIKTEDISRTYFREISEGGGNDNQGGGDDNQGGNQGNVDNPSALVGIWTQYHQEYTTGSYLGYYIGIKLDANGEAAYTEWGNNDTPNWNYTGGGKWSASGGVLTIYAPNGSVVYSSAYSLSSDGKTITFIGDTTEGHFSTLKGEFTKQ